jgi:hypothetical protein
MTHISEIPVDHLDIERLLQSWRWLCPGTVSLVARNAFGELFLRDEHGRILRLDVTVGQLTEIASSESQFRDLLTDPAKQEEWLAETDTIAAAERGLQPSRSQCIGFKIPLVFAESGFPDNAYVADLYEYVAFLGDLHEQIANSPDGTKVRLRVLPS